MAKSITFNSSRRIDKSLFHKLNNMAPKYHDDPTGLARKLLHEKLDEINEPKNIKIQETQPQSAVG